MYPTYTKAAKSGETGVHLVSTIVHEDFFWIFRRTHQEHDFGIDGYIDYVTPQGGVTGQFFACQIKSGTSFFNQKTAQGYVYRGELKHFNYLCNQPTAVLIIICHPKSGDCYWTLFDKSDCTFHEQSWTTVIPFDNKLQGSANRLSSFLPPAPDHLHQSTQAGMLSAFLDHGSHIIFSIAREDVKAMSVEKIRGFFDHLRSSRELARRAQGRVEITFDGYDKDRREVFEIPEIRSYAPLLDLALPELFFFAWSHERSATLRVLALCQAPIIEKRVVSPNGEYLVQIDAEFLGQFLIRHSPGLNDMTAWLGMSEGQNKKIFHGVLRALEQELPPDEDVEHADRA